MPNHSSSRRVQRSLRRLVFTIVLLALAAVAPQEAVGQAAGLKIVVIDGEDAVNIVQQRTAVTPVVEVRDRNDQPVAGAMVRFAIRNGRATFSGARSLSVVTNTAGRAVAAGLTPTGSGALQIGASAAFQGETAIATIAQTNVMTAAQAASIAGASSAGGTGGGAGAGAGTGGAAGGGTGGGLSATTIGIVGGAAAGGAIAAGKVLGGGDGGRTHFSGQFSGPETEGTGACQRTFVYSGTVEMELDVAADGTVTGDAQVHGNWEMTALAAACTALLDKTGGFDVEMPVNGTAGQLAFNKERVNNYPGNQFGAPNGGFVTETYSFTGSMDGGTITGTLFHRQVNRVNQSTFVEEGSASFPVTLK